MLTTAAAFERALVQVYNSATPIFTENFWQTPPPWRLEDHPDLVMVGGAATAALLVVLAGNAVSIAALRRQATAGGKPYLHQYSLIGAGETRNDVSKFLKVTQRRREKPRDL